MMSDMIIHGTVSGYTNRKCRCVACRAAKAKWDRKYRFRRIANVATTNFEHGSAGYIYGCRCPTCTFRHAQSKRQYQLRAKHAEARD